MLLFLLILTSGFFILAAIRLLQVRPIRFEFHVEHRNLNPVYRQDEKELREDMRAQDWMERHRTEKKKNPS